MSHLPFTIAAYLFNSVSVTIDKFLLTKHIPDPLVYIFYFSAFSLIALFLLPFTHLPPPAVFGLASLSTILWTTGAYFMFKALQIGQVSRVIPVIGTLIPLILLFAGVYQNSLDLNQIWAIVILVLGIIFLTSPDWRGKISKKEVFYEIAASTLFAISYLILYQAYQQGEFLSVFVSSRLILIPVGVLIFIIPSLRRRVLTSHGPKLNFFSKAGLLFFLGQSAGGSAELLLTYSVSLATPALVNSLQGVQYVFLFIFSIVLAKKYPGIFNEHFTKLKIISKIAGILLIGFGLFVLGFGGNNSGNNPDLGVTFSPRYAAQLGIDPQKTYLKIFEDLQVKNIRIPIYWDEVEKKEGQYNYEDLNFYLDNAQAHQAKVILVLGQKVPRWPECFIPDWLENAPNEQKNTRLLQLISSEVKTFKDHPALTAWQIENEPLLEFGICPKSDKLLLEEEVKLARSIDPTHPILITSSGELSWWVEETKIGDWFGTTMYRTVWDKIFGYFNYPFPPVFYQLKRGTVGLILSQKKNSIIAELQAEPWVPAEKNLSQIDPAVQSQLFPAGKMRENLEFAKATNFSSVYFWGVEWWYYMEKQGHSGYLNLAKEIFNPN